MKEHTTHFDDCGCKTADLTTRLSLAEKQRDRAVEALREYADTTRWRLTNARNACRYFVTSGSG